MSTCRTGKKAWASQEEAEAKLEEIREEAKIFQRAPASVPARAYRCEFCQQYHLTHQPKKNRRSMS